MDRADGAGLSVAVAGHVALFGVLSLGLAASVPPKPVPPPAMEVEFVETMALEPAAAEPVAEQQAAEAPEIGPMEEAMPAPAPVVTPAPVPEPVAVTPPPEPVAAPPRPAPRPEPVRAKPVKQAAPKPKPAPARTPAPKPAPAKKAAAKPAPPKAAPAKTAAKATPVKTAARTKSAPGKATAQASGNGEKTAARASRLGKDFLAGLSDPSPAKAKAASAAPVMSADAMAGIQAAIKRQIQPCANRNVNPGPGASRITVKLNVRLNKDGSLAGAPRVVSTSGVDDENSRYEKRVADLAIAAYKGCAPMKGLPVDLYRTAKGGWSNVNMNYKLPG